MKVYVDELHIKNCSCCDFCYTNSQGCVCKLTGHVTMYDEPLEEMRSKCPLLSLADYTKQVRKQVVQEIRQKAVHSNFGYMGKTEKGYYDIYAGILEDIEQGETK